MNFTELSNTYLMRNINPGVLSRTITKKASGPAPPPGRCKAGTAIPADWDWRSANNGGRVPFTRPSQGACEPLACLLLLCSRAPLAVQPGPGLFLGLCLAHRLDHSQGERPLGCVARAGGSCWAQVRAGRPMGATSKRRRYGAGPNGGCWASPAALHWCSPLVGLGARFAALQLPFPCMPRLWLGRGRPCMLRLACASAGPQAALAAVESRAMIDRVDLGPNLSEEQLLDCVNAGGGYRSRGCQGGLAGEWGASGGLF